MTKMAKPSIFDAMVTRDAQRNSFRSASVDDKRLLAAVLDQIDEEIKANRPVDLFDKLKASTGKAFDSWITTDENIAVSVGDIKSALGPKFINEIHSQTHIEKGQIAERLAALLPGLIEELSPAGELPSKNVLPTLIKSMKGRL